MELLGIFFEAALALFILPLGGQETFFATTLFNPEKASMAIPAATFGAVVGLSINWFIGKKINAYLKTQPFSERYARICDLAGRYGWVALLLVWVPLGNFLMVAAGALGMKFKPSALCAGIVMLGYYIYSISK